MNDDKRVDDDDDDNDGDDDAIDDEYDVDDDVDSDYNVGNDDDCYNIEIEDDNNNNDDNDGGGGGGGGRVDDNVDGEKDSKGTVRLKIMRMMNHVDDEDGDNDDYASEDDHFNYRQCRRS